MVDLGSVGGGTDRVATFARHRLMISSRLTAMNSWSMETFKRAHGIALAELRLFRIAQVIQRGAEAHTAPGRSRDSRAGAANWGPAAWSGPVRGVLSGRAVALRPSGLPSGRVAPPGRCCPVWPLPRPCCQALRHPLCFWSRCFALSDLSPIRPSWRTASGGACHELNNGPPTHTQRLTTRTGGPRLQGSVGNAWQHEGDVRPRDHRPALRRHDHMRSGQVPRRAANPFADASVGSDQCRAEPQAGRTVEPDGHRATRKAGTEEHETCRRSG